jgi:hypothetical protein
VDPGASLDDLEKTKFLTLPGPELRPLGRPARSQPLYRQRYPKYTTQISMNYITLYLTLNALFRISLQQFIINQLIKTFFITPDIVSPYLQIYATRPRPNINILNL